MIVQERFQLEENGWVFVKTYSDSGMKISQDETGALYDEAIDPEFTNRTYTETDIPIENEEETELSDVEQKAQAWDALIGEENINE